MEDYLKFLESKKQNIEDAGFELNESKLNENLFDFQRFIVLKSLKKGRFAIFADCGLGKTLMQLEWSNQVVKKNKKTSINTLPVSRSRSNNSRGFEVRY